MEFNFIFLAIKLILVRLRLAREKLAKLVYDLREALENLKVLKRIIPICALCKKVRDDAEYWQEVEAYITMNSDAMFTHGMCQECKVKVKEQLRSLQKN